MPESISSTKNIKRVSLTLFFCLLATSLYAQTELSISSATASSYSGSYTPSKTIDKNLSTYWRGAANKSYWWLSLDLSKPYTLSKLSIFWHKNYGSTNYSIQASNDNVNWTNLYTGLSSAGGTTNPYQKDYNLTGSYRYIRLYINNAQRYYPIIYEVKLYGLTSTDTTPPTLSIASPLNNSTVSATTEIQAQATDNVAVAKVEFYLDDSLKSQDITSPYSYSWDTTTVSNGNHNIRAVAYDASNNSAQDQITVKVNNITPLTYTISPVSFSWVETTTATGITGDDQAKSFSLPFSWRFFGASYTAAQVSSNGLLQFGSCESCTAYSPRAIPNPAPPNRLAAVFWRDLHPQGGSITYSSSASQFVVTWNNVRNYANSQRQSFQVILKPDGSLIFQYKTITTDISTVIGVENVDGSQGLAYTSPLQNNLAIKFTPANSDTTPPGITSVTPSDGATFYESDSVAISPTVEDTDPSPLEYQFSLDGAIEQAWSEQASYTWTASSGIHKIKVEVRDIGGQDTKEIELCVFRKPISPP